MTLKNEEKPRGDFFTRIFQHEFLIFKILIIFRLFRYVRIYCLNSIESFQNFAVIYFLDRLPKSVIVGISCTTNDEPSYILKTLPNQTIDWFGSA